MVQCLCEQGTDKEARGGDHETGVPPMLMAACSGRLPVVQYQCEQKAPTRRRDEDGETPLYVAAFYGCLPVVQYPCEQGADIAARNNNGESPEDGTLFNGEASTLLSYLREHKLARGRSAQLS